MKTVAVIFGSRSAEHDVSIVTAISAVIKPLKLSGRYNVVPVYIAKNGSWYSDDKLTDISFYSSGLMGDKLKKLRKINLKFDDGLWLIKPGLGGEKIHIDVVFPATHGTYGEDGSLMGLLEMADVPYVGCSVAASAVSMNKILSRLVVEGVGIDTNEWKGLKKATFEKDQKKAIKSISELKMPLFVKPSHLGSSIAISRVRNDKELSNALEVVFHYDTEAIIEEEVSNLVEVTVPVMGNSDPKVAMVEQILSKKDEFFDFDSKYMHGGKKGKNGTKSSGNYSRIPAGISKELYTRSDQMAKDAYLAIGCEGVARVDLLIDSKSKKVYFNEINPMPGSLYQHNWVKAGVSNVQLVENLVDLAFKRHETRKTLSTSFKTNFLEQF